MKQIFTFLLVAFGSINTIHAQIKLTQESHGFKSGDEHACQILEYKAPGDAGKNVVWDFSDVVLKDNIGVATIEDLSGDLYNKATLRNDGIKFFYNVTENQVEFRGYERENYQNIYTLPIVKIRFPQAYGTSFEGAFAGDMLVKGQKTGDIAGTYSTHVDGEGTILLPNGEKLPVIRVKTTKVTTKLGSVSTTQEVIKYLWYAQDVRYPVFVSMETAYYNSTGKRVVLENSSYLNTNLQRNKLRSTVDLNAIDANFTYKVFPNPFKEQLNVQYSLGKQATISAELYNTQGAKVAVLLSKQVQQGVHTINYNTAAFTKGIYFLRFTVDGKAHIEKLIKN